MNHKILNGNELLIEGGLEAGFNLYTGYPGSPLADFFNILDQRKEELKSKGIRVVLSNSEANAAAMASGAKMAGQNVMIGMKSMGLNVASDALSVGNFANPGPISPEGKTAGVVIAVGDDPWSISTSAPVDSRFLFKHLHIPFLEPSTPQELKDWVGKALQISQNSSVYVGILLTTFMAEGGGRVTVNSYGEVSNSLIDLDPETFDLSKHVMVPPNSLKADIEMINRRFPKVMDAIDALSLDENYGSRNSDTIFISTGATAEILKQVLEESHLLEHFCLYKSATSFPLSAKQIAPFLRDKKRVVIVEEKRDFLENELINFIQKQNIKVKVFGKKFETQEGFPAHGGLSYEIIYEKIQQLLKLIDWGKENNNCNLDPSRGKPQWGLDIRLPTRLPTFCPGCPHRETLSLLKDLRKTLKDENLNLISHGDVGCYSLSFLEPFKEMHDLSAMGQGGAMGSGTDLFSKNPSVVLMGDSTFFHSGMSNISNSVQMGHNITYILLDNDNTAMTGHQVTPRTGVDVSGEARPRQNMLDIARSMQVADAIEVNPSDRYFYKNLLYDFVKKPGVKVIVSNKECALTFHSRSKKRERAMFASGGIQKKRGFYQINTLACEDCRACVEMTGCPGLSQSFDAYGTKVMIDPQICVSDSYCTKIKACPSFELVEVANYHPTKYQQKNNEISDVDLPRPHINKTLEQIAAGDDFNVVVIGVGGSGVTTISRVLAEAAGNMQGREDLNFKFVDQKGLAQRNGSVTSHLSIFSHGKSHSQTTVMGSADLVLSPDLLEGARAINYLKKDGLLVIDSEYQIPLSVLLDDGVKENPLTKKQLQSELISKFNKNIFMANMKERSFETFQKSVYSSAMLLGMVFQAGRLPFELESMHQAFQKSVPKTEFENNWQAFQMGRKIIIDKDYNHYPEDGHSFLNKEDFIQSVKEAAYPWQSKSKLINKFEKDLAKLKEGMFPLEHNHLTQYLHDLYVFDHGENVTRLHQDGVHLKSLFPDDELYRIAFRILVKTYWIKDEVFVAHQLSGHLKMKYDQKTYKNIGTSYEVKHINRPHFEIFGKIIEFDIHTRDWMLKIFKHLRILRKLMSEWHSKERRISGLIRTEVLNKIPSLPLDSQLSRLKEIDNIKGYREVRYQKAQKYLKEFQYE